METSYEIIPVICPHCEGEYELEIMFNNETEKCEIPGGVDYCPHCKDKITNKDIN